MNNGGLSSIAGATIPRLVAFYLSRDRILSLIDTEKLSPQVLLALQGKDVSMASAILSNAVGSYVLDAIASGGINTLQQLAVENAIKPGTPFIYNGHLFGNGFGNANKTLALTLTKKLDEPMEGKKLVLEFSKNGIVNATAYVRMAGSARLFAFAYITDVCADTIRAVPYAIGDLVSGRSSIAVPFASTLELQPNDIAQFSGRDRTWTPSKAEFGRLAEFPEHKITELICHRLDEKDGPHDWGGEESDLFSDRLLVGGERKTGAFLLKGPAKFHPMTPRDLGKNADQIYRLFNIPAQVYVIQHCHNIGAAVRKTVEAYALHRSFTEPCRYVIMDGLATAQLLRAHGLWDTRTPARRVRKPAKTTGRSKND